MTYLHALVLGLVEGITEFLPVSSTGHLILAGQALGVVGERAKVFEIFIQLGAILAVVWLYRSAFVGLAQVLSLVPGVSRSGATIMGGLALGLSRPAATEFSFFLAVPVMIAATLFDLLSSRGALAASDVPVFAVGFVAAFASALVVVRLFLRYVARHTFVGFAWYRIALGLLVLAVYASSPTLGGGP